MKKIVLACISLGGYLNYIFPNHIFHNFMILDVHILLCSSRYPHKKKYNNARSGHLAFLVSTIASSVFKLFLKKNGVTDTLEMPDYALYNTYWSFDTLRNGSSIGTTYTTQIFQTKVLGIFSQQN